MPTSHLPSDLMRTFGGVMPGPTSNDAEVLPHRREISDPWSMAKDGKVFLGRRVRAREWRK